MNLSDAEERAIMLSGEVRHLVREYAYATECNLATLEELEMLKSTSQSRLKRQRTICDRMVAICDAHSILIDLRGMPRLKEELSRKVVKS